MRTDRIRRHHVVMRGPDFRSSEAPEGMHRQKQLQELELQHCAAHLHDVQMGMEEEGRRTTQSSVVMLGMLCTRWQVPRQDAGMVTDDLKNGLQYSFQQCVRRSTGLSTLGVQSAASSAVPGHQSSAYSEGPPAVLHIAL